MTDAAYLLVMENHTIRSIVLSRRRKWSLGRQTPFNQPDIPLSSVIAGRVHGEFMCREDVWYYTDQGSINGTYYNGRKLEPEGRSMPTRLADGDLLRIDSGDLCSPDERGVWMLFTGKAEQLIICGCRMSSAKKELICSFHTVETGCLVAVLPSSDVQKEMVMAYMRSEDGYRTEAVLQRPAELFSGYGQTAAFIGRVSSEDRCHPMLTVEEELGVAVRNYFLSDTTKKEIIRRTDEVIRQMKLESVRQNRIRECDKNVRKRVNIGMELAAGHPHLWVDLSKNVPEERERQEFFQILRTLAHRYGKIIVLVIHEGTDTSLFDQVITIPE